MLRVHSDVLRVAYLLAQCKYEQHVENGADGELNVGIPLGQPNRRHRAGLAEVEVDGPDGEVVDHTLLRCHHVDVPDQTIAPAERQPSLRTQLSSPRRVDLLHKWRSK